MHIEITCDPLTHKHRAVKYNYPPTTNSAWYSTHDAGAVIPDNPGPMQRKHLIWTGRAAGRRLQHINLANYEREK
jgi:hypothetical protein